MGTGKETYWVGGSGLPKCNPIMQVRRNFWVILHVTPNLTAHIELPHAITSEPCSKNIKDYYNRIQAMAVREKERHPLICRQMMCRPVSRTPKSLHDIDVMDINSPARCPALELGNKAETPNAYDSFAQSPMAAEHGGTFSEWCWGLSLRNSDTQNRMSSNISQAYPFAFALHWP